MNSTLTSPSSDSLSTLEVAKALGMAVRSIQLMVDRGELQAWRTPGGHRRITRESFDRWRASRGLGAAAAGQEASPEAGVSVPAPLVAARAPRIVSGQSGEPQRIRVLVIEDSKHYQNLLGLLLRAEFPQLECHFADDGVAGLATAGQLQPDVLVVDILLPGIDGAALIAGLRGHPRFASTRLIVVTSLDEEGLEPYRFALAGIPVIHKAQLVAELPVRMREALDSLASIHATPASVAQAGA